MRTRRSPRNQDRLYHDIGRQLAREAARPTDEGGDRICPDGPKCPDPRCRAERQAAGMAIPEPLPHLYDTLIAYGCNVDSHESDLYVKVTDVSQHILRCYGKAAQIFRSQIDGSAWYDVPFMYKPFWDRVAAKERG